MYGEFFLDKNNNNNNNNTRGKSVELQLIYCLKTWISAINDNKFIDIIYFDFKKAFDKVSHTKFSLKSKILAYLVIFINGLRVF